MIEFSEADNRMNFFSALHALPIYNGMIKKGIDASAVVDYMKEQLENCEYQLCSGMIALLFVITDRPTPPELSAILSSPEEMPLMVEEFIADFDEIDSDAMDDLEDPDEDEENE